MKGGIDEYICNITKKGCMLYYSDSDELCLWLLPN